MFLTYERSISHLTKAAYYSLAAFSYSNQQIMIYYYRALKVVEESYEYIL